jgi:competence ComEA-like helix-hairpin-helix protein
MAFVRPLGCRTRWQSSSRSTRRRSASACTSMTFLRRALRRRCGPLPTPDPLRSVQRIRTQECLATPLGDPPRFEDPLLSPSAACSVTVERVVSAVGVNLDTASADLLAFIPVTRQNPHWHTSVSAKWVPLLMCCMTSGAARNFHAFEHHAIMLLHQLPSCTPSLSPCRYERGVSSNRITSDCVLSRECCAPHNGSGLSGLWAGVQGIGRSVAKRIVALRAEEGRFSSREDLLRVHGLGKKTFQQVLRLPARSTLAALLSSLAPVRPDGSD